jgi:hypothetical protein
LSENELRDARLCTRGVAVQRLKGMKTAVKRWVVCMHPPYPDEEEHCPHGAIVLYDVANCTQSAGGARVPSDDAFAKIDMGINCSDMWRFSKIDAAALHLQKPIEEVVSVNGREVSVMMWSEKSSNPGPKLRKMVFASTGLAQQWRSGLLAMLAIDGAGMLAAEAAVAPLATPPTTPLPTSSVARINQAVEDEEAPPAAEDVLEQVVRGGEAATYGRDSTEASVAAGAAGAEAGPIDVKRRVVATIDPFEPLGLAISESADVADVKRRVVATIDPFEPLGLAISESADVAGHHAVSRVMAGSQSEIQGVLAGDAILELGEQKYDGPVDAARISLELKAAVMFARESDGHLRVVLSRSVADLHAPEQPTQAALDDAAGHVRMLFDPTQSMGFGLADLNGQHHAVSRVDAGSQAERNGMRVQDSFASVGGEIVDALHGSAHASALVKAAVTTARTVGSLLEITVARRVDTAAEAGRSSVEEPAITDLVPPVPSPHSELAATVQSTTGMECRRAEPLAEPADALEVEAARAEVERRAAREAEIRRVEADEQASTSRTLDERAEEIERAAHASERAIESRSTSERAAEAKRAKEIERAAHALERAVEACATDAPLETRCSPWAAMPRSLRDWRCSEARAASDQAAEAGRIAEAADIEAQRLVDALAEARARATAARAAEELRAAQAQIDTQRLADALAEAKQRNADIERVHEAHRAAHEHVVAERTAAVAAVEARAAVDARAAMQREAALRAEADNSAEARTAAQLASMALAQAEVRATDADRVAAAERARADKAESELAIAAAVLKVQRSEAVAHHAAASARERDDAAHAAAIRAAEAEWKRLDDIDAQESLVQRRIAAIEAGHAPMRAGTDASLVPDVALAAANANGSGLAFFRPAPSNNHTRDVADAAIAAFAREDELEAIRRDAAASAPSRVDNLHHETTMDASAGAPYCALITHALESSSKSEVSPMALQLLNSQDETDDGAEMLRVQQWRAERDASLQAQAARDVKRWREALAEHERSAALARMKASVAMQQDGVTTAESRMVVRSATVDEKRAMLLVDPAAELGLVVRHANGEESLVVRGADGESRVVSAERGVAPSPVNEALAGLRPEEAAAVEALVLRRKARAQAPAVGYVQSALLPAVTSLSPPVDAARSPTASPRFRKELSTAITRVPPSAPRTAAEMQINSAGVPLADGFAVEELAVVAGGSGRNSNRAAIVASPPMESTVFREERPWHTHRIGTLYRAVCGFTPTLRQRQMGAVSFAIGDRFRLMVTLAAESGEEWARVRWLATQTGVYVPRSHLVTQRDGASTRRDKRELNMTQVSERIAALEHQLARKGGVGTSHGPARIPAGTILRVIHQFAPTADQLSNHVIALTVGDEYCVREAPSGGGDMHGWVYVVGGEGRSAAPGYAPSTFFDAVGTESAPDAAALLEATDSFVVDAMARHPADAPMLPLGFEREQTIAVALDEALSDSALERRTLGRQSKQRLRAHTRRVERFPELPPSRAGRDPRSPHYAGSGRGGQLPSYEVIPEHRGPPRQLPGRARHTKTSRARAAYGSTARRAASGHLDVRDKHQYEWNPSMGKGHDSSPRSPTWTNRSGTAALDHGVYPNTMGAW